MVKFDFDESNRTQNLLRNRPIYEPPRFMTIAQAATLLMQMEAEVRRGLAVCVE